MAERLKDLPLPETAGLALFWTSRSGAASLGTVAAILRHEVRQLTATFRFRALGLLVVLLMLLAAMTAAARYHGQELEQRELAADHARELRGATVDQAAEILQPAFKAPWRLSLVVDGGQSATPDAYSQALSPLVSPRFFRIHRGNERLPFSTPIDWSFVIRLALSFAAFLLGYDAVCGERRTGTLKLVLTYPIARWKVFAGKLLAIWSVLAVPFLAAAALSLIVARLEGISFQSGDLTKAGLVALVGLWILLLSALVALLVSSLARDSSTSLGILVWLWVTAVIVVPAVGGLLARRLHSIPAEGETGREMAAIDQRISREHAGRDRQWRRWQWAAADGFAWERTSAEAETRRFVQKEEVRRRVLQRKLGQARLAEALACLSPAALAGDLAERLAGTGLSRDASFLEQAWAFRPVLGRWLRALDAGDPESPHILFFSGYLSRKPLAQKGPGSIPRFAFHEETIDQGLTAARPILAILAGETLALAAAALFFFSRSGVS
ncbi:MAG TPA: ABC transporter permease subunit [Thermoanaerobaculia bacterium]|jgi:ABC-type transport system involved in multi-copper enzyme maturation permease subunit|nr:ABC transporter permease subunit [Thermoanaerobaculia bacterium]